MGGVVGSPVDERKQQEIKELIESVLKTFTLQYTKAYGIALLKKIKHDVTAEPEDWKLDQRPDSKPKEPLKEGYLTKQGAVRKNWLKRYFVVRPDYKIEYYETEEAYRAKKQAKGVIAPCGYSVKADVAKDMLERLAEIAEKMGAQAADLPQPDKMPENCMEIHHHRRRCYFIHAESDQEKNEWFKVFKQCAWRCWGFENEDPVANEAFKEAIRRTRWELGRWGYWSYGGTETQILTDLIVDELNWTILSDIYYNLKGPWAVRWKIRNQLLKTLDTMVSAAVAPALKAMETAIKTLRGRIEGMIREKIEPIFKAEEEIKEKIKGACLDSINPTLSEKVAPRLAGILQILISPMTDAFAETRNVFETLVQDLVDKVEKDNGFGTRIDAHFRSLDNAPHSYWKMRPAYDKTDIMEDPLWALRQFFDDIHPWSLIYEAHTTLKKVLDNAFYTFEEELVKAVEDTPAKTDGAAAKTAIEKCRDSVQEKFSQDAQKATLDYYKAIMLSIILPFLQKIINPVCKPLIEPIASAIPDAFSDIIDIEEMFDDTVTKIVTGAIDTVVDHVNTPAEGGD